ncbi:MAG: OsmC family protein [Acidobacteria bacterium]|nr:OsmC family protein [Acidobacteriota bacterium]
MGNTVQIRIDQTGAVTSTARVRDHRISVDRPLERGGENQGPMGGELILVGLGGCFTSNLLAAIRARQAAVSGVSTIVTATLAENPSRFAAIDLAVSADCSDAAVLDKLVAIAERGCIAANTLRDGVKLTVRVARS